jgi:hypothetical protein
MKRLLVLCSPVYLPRYLLRIRDETVGTRSTRGPPCAAIDANQICALTGFYPAQVGTLPIIGVPRNFVQRGEGGWVQQIQLRTDNGFLWAVAP